MRCSGCTEESAHHMLTEVTSGIHMYNLFTSSCNVCTPVQIADANGNRSGSLAVVHVRMHALHLADLIGQYSTSTI